MSSDQENFFHSQHVVIFCKKCNQAITTDQQSLIFNNNTWHKNCLQCFTCNHSLATQKFHQHKGHLYCNDCMKRILSKQCRQCRQVISKGIPYIEINGQYLHSNCFICFSCHEPITHPYISYNQNYYHQQCLNTLLKSGVSNLPTNPNNHLTIRNQSKHRPQTGILRRRAVDETLDSTTVIPLNRAHQSEKPSTFALKQTDSPQIRVPAKPKLVENPKNDMIQTSQKFEVLTNMNTNFTIDNNTHTPRPKTARQRLVPIRKMMVLNPEIEINILAYKSSHLVLPKIKPPEKQTCQICMDEKLKIEFATQYNSGCSHEQRFICDDCLYRHVKQTFENSLIEDYCCVEANCGIRFDYEAIKKVLINPNDQKCFERYDRFCRDRELERKEDFIWCAYGCGCGQFVEDGMVNNIITCRKCRQKTCFIHRIKWHNNLTCAQYDHQNDVSKRATEKWLAQNTKKCPKCSVRIQKNDGCDHMICRHCRYGFCWACLADYETILADGNHRHEPTCKYYFAYDG